MSTSLSPGVPIGTPETPADLLDQADYLLASGYPIAAGMMTRGALETYLRQLCKLRDCEPPLREARRSIKDALLDHLRRADVFDRETRKEAARLFELGNAVVHCEVSDATTIGDLLHDVRRFVWRGGVA